MGVCLDRGKRIDIGLTTSTILTVELCLAEGFCGGIGVAFRGLGIDWTALMTILNGFVVSEYSFLFFAEFSGFLEIGMLL